MNARQGLTVLAIILALLLLGLGWWAYGLHKEKTSLTGERDQLESELSEVNLIKSRLETEVDSLEQAYISLTDENATLQSSLADAQATINLRDATIRKLRQTAKSGQQAKTQVKDLSSELQALLNIKSQLELNIKSLQSENDSLRVLAGVLVEDLSKAREENTALANLNRAIQEEVDRLTLANFKASAFRIEPEKKNTKATAKSRRARRMKISFDLTDVPPEYRGVRPIYLVISDEQGTPIKMDNPVKAQVKVNGQITDLLAAEAKEVNIAQNQRLSFTHDLAQRLKSGYYRALVFTDIGLLGASSFRLR